MVMTIVHTILSIWKHCMPYGADCYKDYPGLGNRSIVYPCSSAGTTLTFGVVEDTGSNLTSDVSLIETLARAAPKDV